MQKKKLLTILGVMLAVVVASLSLVFTVGPMVSADDDEPAVMDGNQYFKITSGTIGSGYDWLTEAGWDFIEQHDRIKLVIPEGITAVDGYQVGEWVETILDDHYYYDEKIVAISLPSTLIRIGTCAFFYMENLTSVEIPNGVTKIGQNAFAGTGITSIKLPSTLRSIDAFAFDCCPLTSLYIPKSVTEMEGNVAGSNANHSGNAQPMVVYCEAESKPAGWSEHWLNDYDVGVDSNGDGEIDEKIEVVWGYKPQGANNNENQNSENENHENENNVTETNDTVVNDNRGNEVKVAAVAGTTGGIAGIGLGTVGTVLGFVIAKKRRK